MKKLCIILLFAILFLVACTPTQQNPPLPPVPDGTTENVRTLGFNTSAPIENDSFDGQPCRSLVISQYLFFSGDREQGLSHIEISHSDIPLLGVVAMGRSLPHETVDGKKVFYLIPSEQELPLMQQMPNMRIQLFLDSSVSVGEGELSIREVYENELWLWSGEFLINGEPQRLLRAEEIDRVAALPTFTNLPKGCLPTPEVKAFSDGRYTHDYTMFSQLYATPSSGKFEKTMQYEMASGNFCDIQLYTHKGVNYYVVESWPSGPDVSEESHEFSIRWETNGYEYHFRLGRFITAHDEAKAIVHGIRY
jgi:hypothetical protein